ncbi:hypothetical protein UFOVP585_12 [uncultured Caudovirales phage]|uniref:Uncharacterized protein n=1 Tax=uncultured Caudovirales phage TaxID=2100421 RepID=A0A6J5N210_9CAUD|nr:hypothetical protein UFOVP585_12 [uncultured Caudovirales phage]
MSKVSEGIFKLVREEFHTDRQRLHIRLKKKYGLSDRTLKRIETSHTFLEYRDQLITDKHVGRGELWKPEEKYEESKFSKFSKELRKRFERANRVSTKDR